MSTWHFNQNNKVTQVVGLYNTKLAFMMHHDENPSLRKHMVYCRHVILRHQPGPHATCSSCRLYNRRCIQGALAGTGHGTC